MADADSHAPMELSRSLQNLGYLYIDPAQQQCWRRGELHREWASRFPCLFDDDDMRLAESQGLQYGTQFIEWLGAVVLHHATGFHALLVKYEFKKAHPKKWKVVESLLLPESVIAILRDRKKGAQCPDLLMYAPDRSDWFFCEIKGPRDQLRSNQLIVFERLAEAGGRPVCLLTFKAGKRLPWTLKLPRRMKDGF